MPPRSDGYVNMCPVYSKVDAIAEIVAFHVVIKGKNIRRRSGTNCRPCCMSGGYIIQLKTGDRGGLLVLSNDIICLHIVYGLRYTTRNCRQPTTYTHYAMMLISLGYHAIWQAVRVFFAVSASLYDHPIQAPLRFVLCENLNPPSSADQSSS